MVGGWTESILDVLIMDSHLLTTDLDSPEAMNHVLRRRMQLNFGCIFFSRAQKLTKIYIT